MDRLLLFIGDRRNIVGMLGAAAGVGLTLGGVIEAWWWAITGGLYAAGFLAGGLADAPAPRLAEAIPVGELADDLHRLAATAGPQLPLAAQAQLTHILAATDAIAEKLRGETPASLSAIPVRQLIGKHVPATLRGYTGVPRRARSRVRAEDGRTADTEVTDQLTLLAAQTDAALDNLVRGDLAALQTQGRFLADKFAPANHPGIRP